MSYAPSVDEEASVCYYEVENADHIAEIIVEDLTRGKIKHILITSEANAFPKLVKWCSEREISLVCQPLIRIEPIKNLAIPQTDWIFLTHQKGQKPI